MKFLGKNSDSEILRANITYRKNAAPNNKRLKEMLLVEQMNFCAYTEKYIQETDSVDVEHFDASKKYEDDYYNYYAVLRHANLVKIKKDNQYKNATFLNTLFFQNEEEFKSRIEYLDDGFYEEIEEDDIEAKELIDFLGFNEHSLYEQRRKHLKRIEAIFTAAGYNTVEQRKHYFTIHKEELSFVTAIETQFNLDLTELYT